MYSERILIKYRFIPIYILLKRSYKVVSHPEPSFPKLYYTEKGSISGNVSYNL